jgi:hypothetical protein
LSFSPQSVATDCPLPLTPYEKFALGIHFLISRIRKHQFAVSSYCRSFLALLLWSYTIFAQTSIRYFDCAEVEGYSSVKLLQSAPGPFLTSMILAIPCPCEFHFDQE